MQQPFKFRINTSQQQLVVLALALTVQRSAGSDSGYRHVQERHTINIHTRGGSWTHSGGYINGLGIDVTIGTSRVIPDPTINRIATTGRVGVSSRHRVPGLPDFILVRTTASDIAGTGTAQHPAAEYGRMLRIVRCAVAGACRCRRFGSSSRCLPPGSKGT